MPKKGRNARHARTQATHSQNTSGRSSPAPALLDVRAGTPDVAASVTELATPEFSLGVEREYERFNAGEAAEVAVMDPMEDSLADLAAPESTSTSVEDSVRPSPLRLSPMLPLLVDVDPSSEGNVMAAGHVRSPVIAAEPTSNLYDSITRTVRGVSSALPRALPTPPRVSRPVSFGSFFAGQSEEPTLPSSPPTAPVAPAQQSTPSKSSPGYAPADRQGAYLSKPVDTRNRRQPSAVSSQAAVTHHRGADEVSELDLEDNASAENQEDATRYGATVRMRGEDVVFSAWDSLSDRRSQRHLLLGYTSGLQVWDCTDLSSVKEVLNLSSGWGKVSCIHVLPGPSTKESDVFARYRPILGVIAEDVKTGEASMAAYSLSAHRIVHRFDLPTSPYAFLANSAFIAISTTIPISLRIFSATNFTTIYDISSPQLISFIPDTSLSTASRITNVLSTHLESSLHSGQALSQQPVPPPPPPPRPIYALSGRLLAFACPPPRQEDAKEGEGVRPRVRTQSTTNSDQALFSVGKVSVSQADIGNAALKVGSGMLSGMRTLGGLAYGAAKSRLAGPEASDIQAQSRTRTMSGGWFSKSAPAGSSVHPGDSSIIGTVREEGQHTAAASTSLLGHYVRVLDLAPLVHGAGPELVAEFVASTSSPVAQLAFMSDGNSLVVAPKDGQVVRVFNLNPRPHTSQSLASLDATTAANPPSLQPPERVYNLRRGRSAGSIEHIEVDVSGRWLGIGTRNGTVHIFAINPYGGKSDERSHLEGRVRNPSEPHMSPTNLNPIVRLRSRRPATIEGAIFPSLAFSFLSHSTRLPPSLISNTLTTYLTPSSQNLSLPPSPAQRPVSTSPSSGGIRPQPQRTTNSQDTLLFDAVDGVLSLRRVALEQKRTDSNYSLSVSSSVPIVGGTSMSLPSMAPLSRLGSSPPPSTTGSSPHSNSGLAQIMEGPSELVGKEITVATWSLKRSRDWKEIRQVLNFALTPARPRGSMIGRPQWIAQAELSTFSRPNSRSLYLQHQFQFQALSGDYHGLLRGFHFDVPGPKIEVRKEVEVSAYPSIGGRAESFHGTMPRDIGYGHERTMSGTGGVSFNESLSSALSGGLEYSVASPTQLPMYPNGLRHGGSYRTTAPIRAVAAGLGEGVTEGIGRLRRGMTQVRSPKDGLVSTSVPLEFDEGDLVLDGEPAVVPPSPARPSMPLSHIRQNIVAEGRFEGGDDAWSGWDEQDRQAVDDEEQFDDLVVGDLDEDHSRTQPTPAPIPDTSERVRGAKGKKKGKK